VFSQLDANAGTLAARLRGNRNYMSLQFLPIYFDSWEDLRSATQYFAAANGDPNRARDPQVQNVIAFLAGAFPTAADREWLRVFMTSIEDESAKFYHSYWLQEQREREPATRVTDSLWQKVYYPKFRRFLMGSQQSMGRMMLSLPIGGEGRTVGSNPASVGSRSTTVVMTYPENAMEALEPIYVLAHELVGTMMNTVVNDNTTPAEKRDGIADRYSAAGLVRAGHILLQRIAPELADGYARYYLRISNSPPGSNPESMLSVAFPLPDSFVSGFRRQLEIVLGGI
jgi:hypothetical protein